MPRLELRKPENQAESVPARPLDKVTCLCSHSRVHGDHHQADACLKTEDTVLLYLILCVADMQDSRKQNTRIGGQTHALTSLTIFILTIRSVMQVFCLLHPLLYKRTETVSGADLCTILANR